MLSSENISGTGWGRSGWTLTNDFISPDGTNNAYSILRTTGVQVSATLSLLANTTYTFSAYIKNVDATNIQLRVQNTAGNSSGTESNCVVFQVTDQTNTDDFVRITHTFNTGDAGSYGIFLGYYSAGEYIVWGTQVEQGSYATSYIPTQGGVVTRVADVCNNAGNEQVINSTEGVLYFEGSAFIDSDFKSFSLSDGSVSNGDDNRVMIGFQNSILYVNVRVGNSYQFNENLTIPIDSNNKIALKYKANDFALWVNGNEVKTDNNGTTFSQGVLKKLQFADGRPTTSVFNGNCKDLRVYNEALTDSELQALTKI